nr:uncharacterized protein CTRU02_02273 [Colletotrichum truncatum]KAF6798300.1 hypothetical protein CTRU02_02273 [Colletotrichum truncatum]
MFPLEESMSMALDDHWSDISEVPDGLEAEESMELLMTVTTLRNQARLIPTSVRREGLVLIIMIEHIDHPRVVQQRQLDISLVEASDPAAAHYSLR